MDIKRWIIYLMLICPALYIGCSKKIDINSIQDQPVQIRTMLTRAIEELGLMTEIYGSSVLKIQSSPLVDRTGPEWKKGGDNSRSITEKIKTAVSSIGGRIKFIPYDPVFAHVQIVQYEPDVEKRLLPDVVIQGEIVDFNPGVQKRGGIGCQAKLIFNYIDFHTLATIARVRTENSVLVKKAKKRNKVSVILSGSYYQKEGTIDRANGGEQAIQMLVDFSMIQLIGKHLALPYWKLTEGASTDPDVLDSLKQTYLKLDETGRISKTQELLFLHGYDVMPTGNMNMETKIALQDYENTETLFHRPVDLNLFLKLYLSLPITDETLERRFDLDRFQGSS